MCTQIRKNGFLWCQKAIALHTTCPIIRKQLSFPQHSTTKKKDDKVLSMPTTTVPIQTTPIEKPVVEKKETPDIRPRVSTIKDKVTIKQKFPLTLQYESWKEAEEAINEYHTGKKALAAKYKKTKLHEDAIANLWKTFHSTLNMEIDCKTGKKMVYKEKKRDNIFSIEVSEIMPKEPEENDIF